MAVVVSGFSIAYVHLVKN